MADLKRAIILKSSMNPGIYKVSTILNPFETKGLYRIKDFPLPSARYAGYKPEVLVKEKIMVEEKFALENGCFETAPSTIFPCWESGFGCQKPYCTKRRDLSACLYRNGMR